ncbi:PIN domain-containing protein [Candidatus Woesearchaeota archaeon]|nr:PIN domain-containing protein [Candidatus Woesearchaeota archaeon]
MKKYLFDSYALIELVKANPKYISYLDSQITITIFNLVEFTYSILQDYGENKAKELCLKFKECVIDVDEETLLEALKFRKEHHRRGLSYADCIGYICAKSSNLLFLTGDEQFRDLPNVEFVKK